MALQTALTSHRVLCLQSTVVVMVLLPFSSSFKGKEENQVVTIPADVSCCILIPQLNSNATKN